MKFACSLLSVCVLAVDPAPGNCYAYTAAKLEWENISDGIKFHQVAGNIDSSALWGLEKKYSYSGGGMILFEYNVKTGKWTRDPTQPAGAYLLAVDSKGMPTIF